jgi:hypothetical protein
MNFLAVPISNKLGVEVNSVNEKNCDDVELIILLLGIELVAVNGPWLPERFF